MGGINLKSWSIDPIAFSIGDFIVVRWYGILIAMAVLVGSFLAMKEAERQGWEPEVFLNILLVSFPCAIIGARLYYVLFNWNYFSRHLWEIPATWLGGLAVHGGLIGGFAAAYLMFRRHRLNFLQGADIVAPSIILGQAIGRWGNFINQEAYGYEADPARIPWAMYIDGAYRHPTFLYESMWNLLVFGFLLWLRKRRGVKTGDVFLSYLILYSAGRYFIEGFRTDSLMLTSHLRAAQVVSLLSIGAGLLILFYRHRRSGV